MNGLALCAGIGGLELGLKLALGDAYRCVGYVEREAFAASVLVARMENAALDRAPIWDDLSTFDGYPWCGRVDLISAGYPCQPFSVAGNRAGEADPRHLWPHVRRIIDEVGPGLVFLENVPGHLSLGFDSVLRDLAGLGFDAEWCVLGADDVGAPHRRKRLWCLAYRDPDGRELLGCGGVLDRERAPRRRDVNGCSSAASVGNATIHNERVASTRESQVATGRSSVGVWPPGPPDLRAWRAVQADAQPSVCRVAHGIPDRVDRLRALGNGVVPLAAAHAFRILAARAMNADQRRVAA